MAFCHLFGGEMTEGWVAWESSRLTGLSLVSTHRHSSRLQGQFPGTVSGEGQQLRARGKMSSCLDAAIAKPAQGLSSPRPCPHPSWLRHSLTDCTPLCPLPVASPGGVLIPSSLVIKAQGLQFH